MKPADKILVNITKYPDKVLTSREQKSVPPIVPVSRDRHIPLSFAQQRLWIHEELEPNTPNNISSAVRILGGLKLDVLQSALDTIIERHEILRTTYTVVSGEPVQIVNPIRSVRIIQNDLSNCPEDEREIEIRHAMAEESQQLFNLSRDLMLRTVLIKLSDNEQVLLLTMHQIATDGRSMMIFFRELFTLYGAFTEGRHSPLPELPVQYADFAVWRRQWMSGEVLQGHLSYWQNQLAGSPLLLELPADRPRPAVRNLRGASHTVTLPGTLAASLIRLSDQEGVTMFVMMMAAFKTLLYRYSGQGDLSVGTFMANRAWPEVEGLIGFFVNAIVLRTDLSDGPSFRVLLQRELNVVQGAFDHYDMPFEKLVEVLNPPRDPGHTPLFQVALAFEDMPSITPELPDLNFEMLDSETSVSLYDLTLIITEFSGDIRLSFIYRTDLFEAATIQRMARNFRTLLESIVSDPDESIFTLPVLSQMEREKIFVEWSNSRNGTPTEDCIHELFEAQVERTTDAVAVIFEGRQMTYRELNCRANQLAHYLGRLGVAPESLVGIYEERSLEMVVGLLGILKTGGAYVPLDPGYPLERLSLMIEDADVTVLLTNARLSARIPSYRGKLVYLDTDWTDISLQSSENPVRKASSDNAACLLYTSGSTGKPKGAILQHSSLVNFILAVISEYGLKSSDRILQFASISFDASAEEIYPCLAIGATLVLRTDEMLTDTDFLQKTEEWKLTVMSLPTAYWHILTQNLERENLRMPATVRLLIIGGERAVPERLAQWQRHVGPGVKILNTYGPTEATVVTTLFDLTLFNSGDNFKRELPVGRPVPGARIYILDNQLQPVPVGVPGELYIGGSVLARGYLNRPDLTAEKFIPDPFSRETGERLYKTGDIVRYLPDGNIEYIGRDDHQVKIRGFRIELGEIEAILRQCNAVREAVVITREDRPGDQRVVAYIIPRDREAVQIRELREFLMGKLPNYMLPSAYILLDSLPLTPNNK
ncbi:MAG TPA: non-ribosomal peptide synthetase, partial [Nitrospiraceae bacterium]|nr:non-ribosomal peptide synthetase [Nitrospiraceae bacterium]